MVRAIVVGVLAMFVLWVGIAAYASSRVISRNWSLFRKWRAQDRETSMRLTLWLGIPLMKIGLFIFSSHVLWSLVAGYQASEFMLLRALAVLPFVIVSIVLQLRWVSDRAYGAQTGDQVWRWLLLAGVALGGTMFATTLWL